ncbi:hypothetical protein D9C73_028416 [Collichthys lucidus]|uniref:Uncharacterized protein n=1 Tax=Collichthys lucidus TaxID=240159 RepID=A0A4U5TVK6_COLLU|nr:hypothetical protein D9C73_028416 [Collichthys lucidus]
MAARPKLRGSIRDQTLLDLDLVLDLDLDQNLNLDLDLVLDLNPAVCPSRVTGQRVTLLISNKEVYQTKRSIRDQTLLDLVLDLNPAVCPSRVTGQRVTSLISNKEVYQTKGLWETSIC